MLHRCHIALWRGIHQIADEKVGRWMPIREEGETFFGKLIHRSDTSSLHTPSQEVSSFHTPTGAFRSFTHRQRPKGGRVGKVSMVYTPSFDGLHTDFRWFTHQAFLNPQDIQMNRRPYPQRNTIFNTKYLTHSASLWISGGGILSADGAECVAWSGVHRTTLRHRMWHGGCIQKALTSPHASSQQARPPRTSIAQLVKTIGDLIDG